MSVIGGRAHGPFLHNKVIVYDPEDHIKKGRNFTVVNDDCVVFPPLPRPNTPRRNADRYDAYRVRMNPNEDPVYAYVFSRLTHGV